jgi:ABC-type histidine transport system ATPase subunit
MAMLEIKNLQKRFGEKEVLKGLKEKQSGLKHDAQYQNGEFIKVQALDRKFKANIELVEQLSAGWRDEW